MAGFNGRNVFMFQDTANLIARVVIPIHIPTCSSGFSISRQHVFYPLALNHSAARCLSISKRNLEIP